MRIQEIKENELMLWKNLQTQVTTSLLYTSGSGRRTMAISDWLQMQDKEALPCCWKCSSAFLWVTSILNQPAKQSTPQVVCPRGGTIAVRLEFTSHQRSDIMVYTIIALERPNPNHGSRKNSTSKNYGGVSVAYRKAAFLNHLKLAI